MFKAGVTMGNIKIVTGHFGSGKTEIAVNMALASDNCAIVDLDTVNPYFRTADAEDVLRERGVRVILPPFARTNVDIPVVPAEVFSVFESGEDVVFDVGGDDDGALALGMYNRYFKERGYEMYFVVCATRPLTGTKDDVLSLIRDVEAASRLRVTHLINNTHYGKMTDKEVIMKGQELCEAVARETGIPIAFTTAPKELIPHININNPLKSLDLYINLPF